MSFKYKLVLILGVTILILDQITKLWIESNFALGETRTVIPGLFNLVFVLNKGAAFGFLAVWKVISGPIFLSAPPHWQ